MQSSTANKLREAWGNTICQHPMLDKEYDSGKETGKYACLICGKEFDEKKLIIAVYLMFLLINYSSANVVELIELILQTF
jgi:hypothetical protein